MLSGGSSPRHHIGTGSPSALACSARGPKNALAVASGESKPSLFARSPLSCRIARTVSVAGPFMMSTNVSPISRVFPRHPDMILAVAQLHTEGPVVDADPVADQRVQPPIRPGRYSSIT